MDLPDFLTRSADGEICLTGHRIGLFHLAQGYAEGATAEMLASRYPTLSLSLVHRVIAFYLDNQVEVDAYMSGCTEALAEHRSGGRSLNLSDLRQRLASGHVQTVPPTSQVH